MDLHLENLTKRFGDTLAVEVPSLAIRQGEFFTFVGPSGCGKSTLLNLISGLEEPSAGQIRVGGQRVEHLPPRARDVAFVFQTYALYPHRTVFGNLAFPLEMAGVPRPEIEARVEAAADMLGLRPLLDKRPRQLSGGERQRVALGRAVVRRPRLFLFDEPLSNLDAPLRAHMRRELTSLHARLGATFIYVTHDQEEALSLSDRIAVMRRGRIEQAGTPDEIYGEPASTFVASFFGSPPMALLEAEADGPAREVVLRPADGREHRLPGVRPPGGGRVTVGIRPEDVRLTALENGWPARVSFTERRGGLLYVELDLGGLVLGSLQRRESELRVGDRIGVELPPEHLHLFDAATGRRV